MLFPDYVSAKVARDQTYEGSSLEPRGIVHTQARGTGQGLGARLLLSHPCG